MDKLQKDNSILFRKYSKAEFKKEHIEDLKRIATAAGQNPEQHANKWLDSADGLIFAIDKSTREKVGFYIYRFINENIIYLASSMILPEHQKKGIASRITKEVVKDYIVKHRIKRINRILKPIYVFFRTQNPVVYAMLKKNNIDLYPNIEAKENIDAAMKDEIIKQAEKIWPYAKLNLENFVLEGAYEKTPKLAMAHKDVQWSAVDEVNDFFKKNIHNREKSLDAQVVIGRIDIKKMIKKII